MNDHNDMFFGASATIFALAKQLRMNPTPAEERLWQYLSKSQTGYRFKRQHPIGSFIADFYCHKVKLVIEVDGDVHNHFDQKDYDTGRTEELEQFGITIIRFTNEEIFTMIDSVLLKIREAISQLEKRQQSKRI